MRNIEKYGDEYIKALKLNDRCSFAQKYVIKDWCAGLDCGECHERLGKWFEQEYKEPQIDWSKVPVDTPVITENGNRHFFKYENDLVYTFDDGTTSWTYRKQYGWVTSRDKTTVQLARPEDIEKYSI